MDVNTALDGLSDNATAGAADAASRFAQTAREMITQVDALVKSELAGATNRVVARTVTTNVAQNYVKALNIRTQLGENGSPGVDKLLRAMDGLFNSQALSQMTTAYMNAGELAKTISMNASTTASRLTAEELHSEPYRSSTVGEVYGQGGTQVVSESFKSVTKTIENLARAIREASVASGNGENALRAQDVINTVNGLKSVHAETEFNDLPLDVNALFSMVISTSTLFNEAAPGYSGISQYKTMLDAVSRATNRIVANVELGNQVNDDNGPLQTRIDNDILANMTAAIKQAETIILGRISLLDDKFAENFQSRTESTGVSVGLLRNAVANFQPYTVADDVEKQSILDGNNSRRVGYVANVNVSNFSKFNDMTGGSDVAHRFSSLVSINARTYLDEFHKVDVVKNAGRGEAGLATDDVGRELRVHVNNLVAAMNAEQLVDPNGATLDALKALHTEAVDAVNQLDNADKVKIVNKFADDMIASLSTVSALITGGLAMMGLGGIYSVSSMAKGTFNRYAANGVTMYKSALTDYGATGGFDQSAARSRLALGQQMFNASSGNIGIDEVSKMYSSILGDVGGHYGASQASARGDANALTSNLFAISRTSGLSQSTMNDALKLYYKDSNMGSTEASAAVAGVVERARQSNVPVETYVKQVVSIGLRLRDVGVYGPGAVALIGDLMSDGMRVEDASSLVEHTAAAQDKLGSSISQSMLYGFFLGNRSSGNPWETYLANNITHDSSGKLIGDHYGRLGAQLKTKYGFILQTAGNGSAGYASVVQSMMTDGYTQKDASQLTSMMMSGDDAKLSKTLKGIDTRDDDADKNLTEAIAKANQSLTTAGVQSAETTKMLTDAKSATMDLATMIDEKLGPLMRTFSAGAESAINTFENMMETLIELAGKLADNPIATNVLTSAAANPLTAVGLVTLGSGILGVGGLAAMAAGRKLVTGAASSLANRGLARVAASGVWKKLGNRYMLIPAAVGAGLLATANSASASPVTKATTEQLNVTLVNGSAKALVLNHDKLVASSTGVPGAKEAGAVLGLSTGLRALISGSQHAGGLAAVAATMVGGELLSSDDRSLGTKALAGGVDALGATGGAAGGALLARRLGLGRGAMFAVMAGGGLAGSTVARQVNRILGLATADDDVLDDRAGILKQTADKYSSNVASVLDSDTEQGNIMRNYLAKNGLDYSTLSGLQKAILSEMFTKLAGAHQSLATTLQAVAKAAKNNNAFRKAAPKIVNGKPVSISADADAAALEDAYMHVQHGNGVYDENYYRAQYAQQQYDGLKEQYDSEDDPSKRASLNEQMTKFASIVSYTKHLNGDDGDLNEEVDKQWDSMGFSMATSYMTKNQLRDVTLGRWRRRYDDDDFVNAAGYDYYNKNVSASPETKPVSTNFTPASVGSGQGAYGRIPYAEWKTAIDEQAAKNGVDPKLMAAMLECESGWRPDAKSGAGAVGLAQFMPDTARGLGIDPNDPLQAIAGQAAYLRNLQEQLGTSDPALLAAAYNAGPDAVRKAGGVPDYAETKNYVNNVLSAYGSGGPGVTPGHWGGLTAATPRTLADQNKANQQAYASILAANGGHTVHGRIVNGMYVDANEKSDTVASIIAGIGDLTPPKQVSPGGVLRRSLLQNMPTPDASAAATKAASDAAKVLNQSQATLGTGVATAEANSRQSGSDEKTDDNTAIMMVTGKLKTGKTIEGLRSAIIKMINDNSGNVNVVKA